MNKGTQIGLFALREPAPPGFTYHREIVSQSEERELSEQLASLPFAPFEFHGYLGKRQIVSYGWKYAFQGSGGLLAAEPIPDFLLPLRDVAASMAGQDPRRFEHLLVTRYGPGAAIGWHKDKAVFGKTLAVSLLSACRLRFRRRTGNGWERRSVEVHPRSLYILADEARSRWEHSIPAVEELRYSLTFRDLADR